MKTGHLFSGAGGGLLADRILGHEPIFAVENDQYCCRILRERAADGWFPGLQVHEQDIRLWDPSEYAGRVDCIHAGFPCQDISAAGHGAGIGGNKSGLWSEVVRIAGILRPQRLFLENSPELVNRGLDVVLHDLAALGYDAKWICLSASRVGAPHIRDRWWCLANANGNTIRQLSRRWNGAGRAKKQAQLTNAGPQRNIAYTDSKRQLQSKRCEFKKRGRDCDGFRWFIEPNLGRVVYGVPSAIHRIKALGNAQVPLQAALAYRLLSQ